MSPFLTTLKCSGFYDLEIDHVTLRPLQGNGLPLARIDGHDFGGHLHFARDHPRRGRSPGFARATTPPSAGARLAFRLPELEGQRLAVLDDHLVSTTLIWSKFLTCLARDDIDDFSFRALQRDRPRRGIHGCHRGGDFATGGRLRLAG